jgi:histidinol-phosphate aminotransferase
MEKDAMQSPTIEEQLLAGKGEAVDDLLSRGYSRRSLGRIAMFLGAGAAALQFSERSYAQQSAKGAVGAVRIGSNECWTGPFSEGVAASHEMAVNGNRYELSDQHEQLFEAVAAMEGVPKECVLAYPGSSDPLNRSVVTFCSPERGLVTANPTYEQAWRTSKWLGVKLTRIPLTTTYAHDVKAMATADPTAGMIYVCSPNNPTGTLTPLADIEWLADNKPKDAMLVVDEAYIHWSDAPRAAKLAASRDDVIVLRTFSKLFGMAGMRLGLVIATPATHQRMMRYDGQQVTNMLPMTAVACGTASLKQTAKIAARREEMIAARQIAFDHLKKRGIRYIPSDANMFMMDWGTGKVPAEMMAKMLANGVQIGRNWDIWPTVSRVTVGSAEEMQKFNIALDKVLMG